MSNPYQSPQAEQADGRELVKVTQLWRNVLLVLCWLVILGDGGISVLAAPILAARHPELATLERQICIVAILSISCALILRKRIVKSIREERREKLEGLKSLVKGTQMRGHVVLVLCLLAIFGNLGISLFSAPTVAAKYPGLRPFVIARCIVALLSATCALILRKRVLKSIQEDRREKVAEIRGQNTTY
jgi:Na+/melibiose symporter-like transporter